jgi:hypothetical protein
MAAVLSNSESIKLQRQTRFLLRPKILAAPLGTPGAIAGGF